MCILLCSYILDTLWLHNTPLLLPKQIFWRRKGVHHLFKLKDFSCKSAFCLLNLSGFGWMIQKCLYKKEKMWSGGGFYRLTCYIPSLFFSDLSLAQWCHGTHIHTNTNHLKNFSCTPENATSICAETMKQRVFEALLKAITIGVESTHDNWFAGFKWETTTNSVGGGRRKGGKKRKSSLDWHPVTVINFTNRPVWRSV